MKIGKSLPAGLLAACLLLCLAACNKPEIPEEPGENTAQTTESGASASDPEDTGTGAETTAAITVETADDTTVPEQTSVQNTAEKTTKTTRATKATVPPTAPPAPVTVPTAATKQPEPSVIIPTTAPTTAPTQPEAPEYTLLDYYAKCAYELYTLYCWNGDSTITMEIDGMTLSAQREFHVDGRYAGMPREEICALVEGTNSGVVPDGSGGQESTQYEVMQFFEGRDNKMYFRVDQARYFYTPGDLWTEFSGVGIPYPLDLTNAGEYITTTPDGEGGTLTGSIPADRLGDSLLVDFNEAMFSLMSISVNQLYGYRFSDVQLTVDMILDPQNPKRGPYIRRFHMDFTAYLTDANGAEIPVRIQEEAGYWAPGYALSVKVPKDLDTYVEWQGE